MTRYNYCERSIKEEPVAYNNALHYIIQSVIFYTNNNYNNTTNNKN